MKINKTVYNRLLSVAPAGGNHVIANVGEGYVEVSNYEGVFYQNKARDGLLPHQRWGNVKDKCIALPSDLKLGIIEVTGTNLIIRNSSGYALSSQPHVIMGKGAQDWRMPNTIQIGWAEADPACIKHFTELFGEKPHETCKEVDVDNNVYSVLRWYRGPHDDVNRYVDTVKVSEGWKGAA